MLTNFLVNISWPISKIINKLDFYCNKADASFYSHTYRWYHGNIYPKDAERILNEKGKYGSYLVRSSYRHPGDYALCVRLVDTY